MASTLQRALKLLSTIHNNILNSFSHPFPRENFALAALNLPDIKQAVPQKQIDFNEIIKKAILWAVPKRRRSLEKRRNRRFGWPELHYKMIVPKTNILICSKCGSYHEAGVLCRTCYEKNMKETQEMQEAIQKELGISLVENEVVVLYDNDDRSNPKIVEGKRVVELQKKRPKLFSNNLLQKSMQVKSDQTGVAVTPDITLKEKPES